MPHAASNPINERTFARSSHKEHRHLLRLNDPVSQSCIALCRPPVERPATAWVNRNQRRARGREEAGEELACLSISGRRNRKLQVEAARDRSNRGGHIQATLGRMHSVSVKSRVSEPERAAVNPVFRSVRVRGTQSGPGEIGEKKVPVVAAEIHREICAQAKEAEPHPEISSPPDDTHPPPAKPGGVISDHAVEVGIHARHSSGTAPHDSDEFRARVGPAEGSNRRRG